MHGHLNVKICHNVRPTTVWPGCSHGLSRVRILQTAEPQFEPSAIPCAALLHACYLPFPSSIYEHRLPTGYSDLAVPDPVSGMLWTGQFGASQNAPLFFHRSAYKRLPLTSKQKDRKSWRINGVLQHSLSYSATTVFTLRLMFYY